MRGHEQHRRLASAPPGSARHARRRSACAHAGPAHGAPPRAPAHPGSRRPSPAASIGRVRQSSPCMGRASPRPPAPPVRASSVASIAGIGVAELEQHLGAARHDARRAGIQRDAPGGPYRARSGHCGKPAGRSRAASCTSATPASLRIAMRVVPAWFCTPSNTMRKRWLPTIAVTMPMRWPVSSSSAPCSICASR